MVKRLKELRAEICYPPEVRPWGGMETLVLHLHYQIPNRDAGEFIVIIVIDSDTIP